MATTCCSSVIESAASSHPAQPAALQFENDDLLAIDTHPKDNLLVSGTVQGDIAFYRFAPPHTTAQCVNKLRLCKDSCRSLSFSKSGKVLFCGCKDKSLGAVDVETQKQLRIHKNAHSSPLNAVHCVSERLLSTGDENGCIKVWDTRAQKEVLSIEENSDFISDMTSKDSSLLCTSGDGSLTVVDLRQKKMDGKSDSSESELLSLSLIKGGTRVVTGNGEGVLGIFMWDLWGDIVERYPILPPTDSIDSLLQISDSVLCTGGMDGKLRAVQILPNKTIGEIGQHSSDYPVDNLRLTHDKQFLVSSSFDRIKFWPLDQIPTMWMDNSHGNENDDDEEEEDTEPNTKRSNRRRKRKKNRKQLLQQLTGKKSKSSNCDDFFSDL